jgi:carbonic anhydrase
MKIKSMLVALALGAASLSASVAVCAAEGHAPHWDYQKGHTGPAHWNELEDGFAGCKLGKTQSPIDIRGAKKAKLAPIGFNYAAGDAEVVNNGHTVQVNLSQGGAIKLADGDYALLQFHFHTPSEEKINGKSYPLVAHFVHKNADGKLAVVAVLFKLGKENAALKPVFDALPAKSGDKAALAGGLDPAAILPAGRSYYAYTGSLTTPPCSEGVQWHVLKDGVTLSAAQLKAFQKLYPMNARPVQALNGRSVQVGG